MIKLDPLIKNRLNPSDSQRVIRAYEVKSYTNKSLYDWFKKTKPKYEKGIFFKIYLDYPRIDLLKKINLRSREMIKKGAIPEVRKFLRLRVPKSKSAYKAIGIQEIKEFLMKKIDINDVIEKISIKTRQYAKRQTTWGRGNMEGWNKINPIELNKFLKKI